MNPREANLVHNFFYQERDKNGWSTEKAVHKRVVNDEETGYAIREARRYGYKFNPDKQETVAYDGPRLTYIGADVAVLLPADKKKNSDVRDILFFSYVRRTRGVTLERGYGSKTTVDVCTEIENSAPCTTTTRIGVPDELPRLHSTSKADVNKFLNGCWKIILEEMERYGAERLWAREEYAQRWCKLRSYAATFMNTYPGIATQKQKEQFDAFEDAFDKYYAGKKVGGYVCDSYIEYKLVSAEYGKVRKAQNDLRACAQRGGSSSNYVAFPYEDPTSEADREHVARANVFAEKLRSFIGNNKVLEQKFTDSECIECSWMYMTRYKCLMYNIMCNVLGFTCKPRYFSSSKSVPCKVQEKLQLDDTDIVIPEFKKDGTLVRFVTNRWASLNADMWDSLKTLTKIALEHPEKIVNKHIGPYTCHGWKDNNLVVGCHAFGRRQVEFFYELLQLGEEGARERLKAILETPSANHTDEEAAEMKLESPEYDELVQECKELFESARKASEETRIEKCQEALQAAKDAFNEFVAERKRFKSKAI